MKQAMKHTGKIVATICQTAASMVGGRPYTVYQTEEYPDWMFCAWGDTASEAPPCQSRVLIEGELTVFKPSLIAREMFAEAERPATAELFRRLETPESMTVSGRLRDCEPRNHADGRTITMARLEEIRELNIFFLSRKLIRQAEIFCRQDEPVHIFGSFKQSPPQYTILRITPRGELEPD
ncbi:MAG: hypothetical protein JW781_05355 [Deltaproteobacteria bacterium]|nr:hypothetical protein [Candidatus Anaeroferrophillacea bacterium]